MKKTVSAVIILTLLLSTAAFAVTPDNHWFKSYESEVIASVPYAAMYSDEFNPDAYVTYYEFAQIASIAIKKSIVYDGSLQDENISRAAALKIICERLGYTNSLTDEEQAQAAIMINDFDTLTDTQKPTAITAYAKGLVKGDENGNFNPDSSITFAELLIIFSRVK